MYTYRFDFDDCNNDEEGGFGYDIPYIWIVAPDGHDLMEVLLEAKPSVEKPGDNDDDWIVPDFVHSLLRLLNSIDGA